MAYVPENNCTASLLYVQFIPLYIVHWVQSLLSLTTLIFCIVNIVWSYKQKQIINFHINVKIILFGALILYSFHSFIIFLNHFGYIILYHLPQNLNSCFYSITVWKCLLLRVISFITVAGFTFVHLAICIERSIATAYINKYQQYSYKIGLFLLFPIFIIPIIWNFWIFSQEDLFNLKAYCMSSNLSSTRLIQMCYILICLDFLAVIIEIVLFKINKRQKRIKISDYSLQKSLQLKENDISIKLILPLSASHTLLFTCYLLIYISLKIIYNNSDGLIYAAAIELAHLSETLYTFINVALFFYLRRKLAIKTRLIIIESNLKQSEKVKIHAAQYLKYW